MNKAYSRINWQNQPSTSTALGATNLNKMDIALNTIDDRVITLDTTKLDLTTANSMVKSFSLDQSTGVITITLLDGTVTTYDTKLEKLAVNFAYDATAQQLVITLDDGTKQYVDMSALITQYEFKDSSTVGFSVDASGKVSASVKNGSITGSHLQPNYLADITVQSQKANASAIASAESATLSKRYAIGIDAVTEKDSAKYFMEQARIARDQAEDISNVGIASDTKLGLVKGNGNVEVQQTDGAMWANGYKDKGTSTGEFITFENADDALAQVNIKGKSTQVSTKKGKNLLPSPTKTETISGITFTVNADGTLTLNGTSTGNFNYFIIDDSTPIKPVLDVGTYTMKKTGKSESRLSIRKLQSTDVYRSDTTDTTFTLTEPFTIASCFITITSGAIFVNHKIEPQIEVGTISTTYEKHSVDSPSPDYPSPIVSAQNFDLVSNKGVNLVRTKSTSSTTKNGITLSYKDGYFIIDGTPTSNTGFTSFSDIIDVYLINGVQYTSSLKNKVLGTGTQVVSNTIYNFPMSDNSSTKKTGICTSNTGLYTMVINVDNTKTYSNVEFKPQIEFGSVESSYTPYKEDRINIPYELGEWNDIKDGQYIQGATDVTITGTETWSFMASNTLHARFSRYNPLYDLTSDRLSTHFPMGYAGMITGENVHGAGSDGRIGITILKSRLTGWDDNLSGTEKAELLKIWLRAQVTAGTPLIVRTKLLNPIVTPLNTYLKTFKGTTNIFTTANPQVELTATFKSQLWTDSYLKDKAIESKIDTNKIVNSDTVTEPGFIPDARRIKAARDDINAIKAINPSSTLKGYFSAGETLLQFVTNCTTNTTKMYIVGSPLPSDVPSVLSGWEFIAEVIVGDDFRKLIYLHPFGGGSPYNIKRMVFTGAWVGEWENTHEAKLRDNFDANNLVEDGWYNCFGGLNLPDTSTRWMIKVECVILSGKKFVYQTAYNYYGGVGYTSPRTRHVYENTSGSYVWGGWQGNDSNTVFTPVIASSYVAIESGGYIQNGRQITVSLRFQVITSIPTYTDLFSGLPVTLTGIAPLNIMRVDNGAQLMCAYATSGGISFNAPLEVGYYVLSGSYVSAN